MRWTEGGSGTRAHGVQGPWQHPRPRLPCRTKGPRWGHLEKSQGSAQASSSTSCHGFTRWCLLGAGLPGRTSKPCSLLQELQELPRPPRQLAPPGPRTSHAHGSARPRMRTDVTRTLGRAGTGHVTSRTHGALAQAVWREMTGRERERERTLRQWCCFETTRVLRHGVHESQT